MTLDVRPEIGLPALRVIGFEGFVPLADMRPHRLRLGPGPGVFVVLRANGRPESGVVVHVGTVQDLRRDLNQLARQLRGLPMGHWGGSLAWGIEIHERTLTIAWAAGEDAPSRLNELLGRPTPAATGVSVPDLRAAVRDERGAAQAMVSPPLTDRVWPVM